MNGGELIFKMVNTPSKEFGVGKANIPISEITANLIVPVPFIDAKKKTFTASLEITIGSNCTDCNLEYYIGEQKNTTWLKYESPIIITKTATITAVSVNKEGIKSKPVTSEFLKIKSGRTITLNATYDNQYAAEGTGALIDMLKGSNNFRTGFWQGYQGQDVEAIVDLGKIETISKISTGFLQDNRSWIWFPKYVDFYTSTDGLNFTMLKRITNDFSLKQEGSFTKEFGFKTTLKTRYVKMIAKNFGLCPDWHLGAGGKSWIFIDEITIE